MAHKYFQPYNGLRRALRDNQGDQHDGGPQIPRTTGFPPHWLPDGTNTERVFLHTTQVNDVNPQIAPSQFYLLKTPRGGNDVGHSVSPIQRPGPTSNEGYSANDLSFDTWNHFRFYAKNKERDNFVYHRPEQEKQMIAYLKRLQIGPAPSSKENKDEDEEDEGSKANLDDVDRGKDHQEGEPVLPVKNTSGGEDAKISKESRVISKDKLSHVHPGVKAGHLSGKSPRESMLHAAAEAKGKNAAGTTTPPVDVPTPSPRASARPSVNKRGPKDNDKDNDKTQSARSPPAFPRDIPFGLHHSPGSAYRKTLRNYGRQKHQGSAKLWNHFYPCDRSITDSKALPLPTLEQMRKELRERAEQERQAEVEREVERKRLELLEERKAKEEVESMEMNKKLTRRLGASSVSRTMTMADEGTVQEEEPKGTRRTSILDAVKKEQQEAKRPSSKAIERQVMALLSRSRARLEDADEDRTSKLSEYNFQPEIQAAEVDEQVVRSLQDSLHENQQTILETLKSLSTTPGGAGDAGAEINQRRTSTRRSSRRLAEGEAAAVLERLSGGGDRPDTSLASSPSLEGKQLQAQHQEIIQTLKLLAKSSVGGVDPEDHLHQGDVIEDDVLVDVAPEEENKSQTTPRDYPALMARMEAAEGEAAEPCAFVEEGGDDDDDTDAAGEEDEAVVGTERATRGAQVDEPTFTDIDELIPDLFEERTRSETGFPDPPLPRGGDRATVGPPHPTAGEAAPNRKPIQIIPGSGASGPSNTSLNAKPKKEWTRVGRKWVQVKPAVMSSTSGDRENGTSNITRSTNVKAEGEAAGPDDDIMEGAEDSSSSSEQSETSLPGQVLKPHKAWGASIDDIHDDVLSKLMHKPPPEEDATVVEVVPVKRIISKKAPPAASSTGAPSSTQQQRHVVSSARTGFTERGPFASDAPLHSHKPFLIFEGEGAPGSEPVSESGGEDDDDDSGSGTSSSQTESEDSSENTATERLSFPDASPPRSGVTTRRSSLVSTAQPDIPEVEQQADDATKATGGLHEGRVPARPSRVKAKLEDATATPSIVELPRETSAIQHDDGVGRENVVVEGRDKVLAEVLSASIKLVTTKSEEEKKGAILKMIGTLEDVKKNQAAGKAAAAPAGPER